MNKKNYPGVTDRVKAVVVDSIILIIFMFVITYIFGAIEHVPENARIIAFLFIFLFYDPLFTSIFGGTIGHMMFGLRVKREKDQSKNIIFPFALARFMVKASLGWISLLTVSGNENRKALHDYLVGSVVVYQNKK